MPEYESVDVAEFIAFDQPVDFAQHLAGAHVEDRDESLAGLVRAGRSDLGAVAEEGERVRVALGRRES